MFDVKAWLADPAMGFSEEEQTALLPQFSTDARVKVLDGGQLRQADYSRQMNDAKTAQATEQP